MELEITIDDSQMQEALAKLEARTSDLGPVMGRIGEVLKASVIQSLDAAESSPWRPSKKKEGGLPLMDRTLGGAVPEDSVFFKAYPDKVEVGLGPGILGSKMEMTEPDLAIRDEDWAEIKKIVEDYILEGM